MFRALTLGLAIILTGATAANAGHGHHGHNHHNHGYGGGGGYYGGYGYGSGFRGGYGTGYGYGSSWNRGGIYHDTSHWDYHPTEVIPHRNHYHVVPGHYHLHNTGHYHW